MNDVGKMCMYDAATAKFLIKEYVGVIKALIASKTPYT